MAPFTMFSFTYTFILLLLLPHTYLGHLRGESSSFQRNDDRQQVDDTSSTRIPFTILHTNDLHSHFSGLMPHQGHYARMASLIHGIRNFHHHDPENPHTASRQHLPPLNNLFLLDNGDMTSGTLYHVLSQAPMFNFSSCIELDFLNHMGFDSTVVGNHEFDSKEALMIQLMQQLSQAQDDTPLNDRHSDSEGLEDLMYSSKSPQHHTKLLCANMHSKCPDIPKFWQDYFIRDIYQASNPSGTRARVAVVGLSGPNSSSVSTHQRKCLYFDGFDDEKQQQDFDAYVESTKRTIESLREDHGVDIVILSAHAGNPEDIQLVKALNKGGKRLVDVHLSSHEHEETFDIHESGTPITQPKEYGQQLGVLQMEYDVSTKELFVLNQNQTPPEHYTLEEMKHDDLLPYHIPITNYIPKDPEIEHLIDGYDMLLDKFFLGPSGFQLNTRIASIDPEQFSESRNAFSVYICSILQKMIDEKLQEKGEATILDAVVIGLHQIRLDESFFGDQKHQNVTHFTFHDIYRIIGSGEIGSQTSPYAFPGDSIVHFYINKKDLLLLIDTMVIYHRFVNKLMQSVFSDSLEFKERSWGIPFWNRIYDVRIRGELLKDIPDSKMIHLATLDTAYQFIRMMDKLTRGWLSIQFRDQWGRPVEEGQVTPLKPVLLLSEYFQRHQKVPENHRKT